MFNIQLFSDWHLSDIMVLPPSLSCAKSNSGRQSERGFDSPGMRSGFFFFFFLLSSQKDLQRQTLQLIDSIPKNVLAKGDPVPRQSQWSPVLSIFKVIYNQCPEKEGV